MTVFNQIESLPLAYLVVLTWVVCASVLGKLLGRLLVAKTSGPLHALLSRDIKLSMTGDKIHLQIFEHRILGKLNTQLSFELMNELRRFSSTPARIIGPTEFHWSPKMWFPEKHWSGCPPNPAV